MPRGRDRLGLSRTYRRVKSLTIHGQVDTSGEQDEVLDYRIVTGFSYSLLELFDVFFLTEAKLMFEYRHSRYEKEEDSEATNSQNMDDDYH